jgi:hypothetical protein
MASMAFTHGSKKRNPVECRLANRDRSLPTCRPFQKTQRSRCIIVARGEAVTPSYQYSRPMRSCCLFALTGSDVIATSRAYAPRCRSEALGWRSRFDFRAAWIKTTAAAGPAIAATGDIALILARPRAWHRWAWHRREAVSVGRAS